MKLYMVISQNYCVICTNCGHITCDITRDDEEYQSIAFVKTHTISDLKKLQDELDIYAYDAIREDGGIENIETIDEYNAVTEDGEKIRIFVPDMW